MAAERLLELLRRRAELMRESGISHGPLIAYHNSGRPKAPREVIERASALGRTVMRIHFVQSDGNGRPQSRDT